MQLLEVVSPGPPGSFRLIGELDASNVDVVRARLEKELRLAHRLTMDASELSFMDGQGLRMLIELGAVAKREALPIWLVNSSRQVRHVLEVAVPDGIPGVEIIHEGT
jgi:anti-anti-sigma factor